MKHIMMALIVVWFSIAAPLKAQEDWRAVSSQRPHVILRVASTDNRRASGTILNVNDTQISIVNEYGEVARFQRGDVRIVEQLVGIPHAKRRGFLKGLAWGALAGIGLSLGPTMAGAEEGIPYVFAVAMGGGAAIGARRARRSAGWIIIYRK
jgi:hypothetical protein